MPTYVWHNGELIDKRDRPPAPSLASDLPSPSVQGFADYESPIDGRRITSSRQRERDLNRSGSYDPRDMPKAHVYRRGREVQMKEARDARKRPEPSIWK